MNRVFRVVWNTSRGLWQVASEIGLRRSKQKTRKTGRAAIASGSLLLVSNMTLAAVLPDGGNVVQGAAHISSHGNSMTIDQTSQKVVIDWQGFSIGKGNQVDFVQPSASAAALNRVVGSQISDIQGALTANGQVFLVNPNGIVFGSGAQVNVGALVASTLDISTADFMDGNYRFEGDSAGQIINEGHIRAADGGSVAMIAARIENLGSIRADQGVVALGAGSRVLLDLGGPVKLEVEEAAIAAHIAQGGAIRADGGLILLTAQAAGDLASSVINHTGVSEARTLVAGAAGEIYLLGDMQNDQIMVAGTLDASAANGGDGGFIETSAAVVSIADDVQVSTRAAQGATGEWLIDPTDVFIVADDASGVADLVGEHNANLTLIKASTVETALANNNVTIATPDDGDTDQGNINIEADVAWSANTLTLTAHNDIHINATMTASDSAGLAMNTGGQVLVGLDEGGFTGRVDLSDLDASSIQINGVDHTIINTLDELAAIADRDVWSEKYYVLGSDIDATATRDWNPVDGVATGFVPIGSFSGSFNGLGHRIDGLASYVASSQGYVSHGGGGLFASTVDADISNIAVTNIDINLERSGGSGIGGLVNTQAGGSIFNSYVTGSITLAGNYVGGLVGISHSSGPNGHAVISNSHAAVEVKGASFVGGLVGAGTVDITDSHVTGNVIADGSAGGLIGNLSEGSIINSYATGDVSGGSTVGGLVGNAYDIAISHSHATGKVSTENSVAGGLIGSLMEGSVSHSFATGDVDAGQATAGGLVGQLQDASISDSHALGAVSAGRNNEYSSSWASAGGLVGSASNLSIARSYAVGDVVGQGLGAGGLVGNFSGGDVSNSYASGAVSAAHMVGGLIGEASGTEITDSYATGNVTATETGFGFSTGGGGLIGRLSAGYGDSTITNSYALGAISGESNMGGLVGQLAGSVESTNAFWNTDTSGQATSAVGEGKTTAELHNLDTFTDAGWDISAVGGENTLWRIFEGYTAPLLRSFLTPLTGTVTADAQREYDGTDIAQTNIDWSGDNLNRDLIFDSQAKLLLDEANAGVRNIVDSADLYSTQQGYDLLVEGQFTVTPRTLTLDGDFAVADRVYDGSTNAILSEDNLQLRNLVAGETLSLAGLEAAYADANAADNIQVSLTQANLVQGEGDTGLLGNYTLSLTGSPTALANIARRELTLSGNLGAAGKVYDGTTEVELAGSELALENLVAGESLSLTDLVAAYADANAGENIQVSLTQANLVQGAGDTGNVDNYTLSLTGSPTALASIARRELTLVGSFNADKVYDGTTTANLTDTDLSLVNLVTGESLSLADLVAAYADASAGENIQVSLIQANLMQGAGDTGNADNYTLSLTGSPTALATIARRELSISGDLVAAGKVYDGTSNVDLTGSELALENLVAGESLSLTDLVAAYADASAGENIQVSLSQANLVQGAGDTGNADNYTLSLTGSPTALASIARRELTVSGSLTAVDKVYDGTTGAELTGSDLALENLVAGESLSLTELVAAFADANAGENIQVSLSQAGLVQGEGDTGNADNYTLSLTSSPTALASIARRELALAGSFNADKVYDGTTTANLTDTDLSLVNMVAGESLSLTDLVAAYADANAGENIQVSLTQANLAQGEGDTGNADNYTLSLTGSPTALASIARRELTVSGSLTAADKVYDGTTGVELTGSELALENLVAGESLSLTDLVAAYADANAGENIQVSLNQANLAQGEGDTGNADNYTLSLTGSPTALASIARRELTLVGSFNADKVYDGTTTANLTETDLALENLVAGESLSLTDLVAAYTDANASENIQVSLTQANLAQGAGDTGNADNYTLSLTGSPTALATIARRELSISGDLVAAGKVYDGTSNVDLTGSDLALDNLVAGESLSLTGLVAAYTDANAGENIQVSLTQANMAQGEGDTGNADNYTLSLTGSPTALATITRRELSISGDLVAAGKVYDGTTEADVAGSDLALDNLVAGESLSLTDLVAAFADANAGENIQVSLSQANLAQSAGDTGNADNYTLSLTGSPTALASIARRELTLVGSFNADKVYDGTTTANLTETDLALLNLVDGESLSLTDLVAAYADANAGENIQVSLTQANLAQGEGDTGNADNYTLSLTGSPTALATIARRELSITGDLVAAGKVYDGTSNVDLTGSDLALDNLVAGESLSLTDLAAAYADANAGENIQVSLTQANLVQGEGDTGNADNYTLSLTGSPTALATIARRELSVAGMSAEDKIYDGNTSAVLVGGELVGFLAGESLTFSGHTGSFATEEVGDDLAVIVSGLTLHDSATGLADNYIVTPPMDLTASILPEQRSSSDQGLQAAIHDVVNLAGEPGSDQDSDKREMTGSGYDRSLAISIVDGGIRLPEPGSQL